MKVHQLARGFREHDIPNPIPTLGCKRLRPLAPRPNSGGSGGGVCDLKSFISTEGEVGKFGPLDLHPKRESPQELGGTRWNPTQEQIGILEMLYRGGIRTPNAQQIEQTTLQLRKYGKIEGKNVFYWFQNHKARERQKQKGISLSLSSSPRTSPSPSSASTRSVTTFRRVRKEKKLDNNLSKRKCKSLELVDEDRESSCNDDDQRRTLQLFPLHPERGP